MSEYFRIAPGIVHETVDGEVIAIDLDNGSYYSLAGSGPLIWSLLAGGASEAELRGALEARFAGVETIAGDVSALLDELRESGLIVADERAPSVAGAVAAATEGVVTPAPNGDETYEPPRFERYTDMKDYFLLDPIHEVDTAGWPRPAA